MNIKKEIIKIAISHWEVRNVGISGLDLADRLEVPHGTVLTNLEQLAKEAKGTLNTNVTLYPLRIEINENDPFDIKPLSFDNIEGVKTHVYFPSKKLLEKNYQKNIQKFFNKGEYTNRMTRGYGQIELIPFNIKVLGKYLNNKENYEIDDDITGGTIRQNSEYLSTLTYEEQEKIDFVSVWYGKRQLKNGKFAVCAILNDLATMSKKEQSYWYGFELEDPIFNRRDESFFRFFRRAYQGAWIESNDPIDKIVEGINTFNKNPIHEGVFTNNSNPYLRYPIQNTYKDYADCCSELFKIVGPDNIKKNKLDEWITKGLKLDESKLIHKQSGRPLSTLQVFTLCLEHYDSNLASEFSSIWEKVKKHRIEGDHKITKPNISNKPKNYIQEFKDLCWEVAKVFEQFNSINHGTMH
ncbi:MAG: hypothetical protein KA270_05255 [Saprospiraceae bacterium]|jgi:hypothetical protein|nr:hypothetical protein [Saprospiraceae bacterium]MBP6566554.1 hypothetical protein [Saprospiraceae bacterium]